MKYWRTAVACAVILALLALPMLGCGDDEEDGKVTIKIGYLTDLTGPASSAMVPNLWAIQDAWEYLKEANPISGVDLKLEYYDTAMDTSRAIPGYEWLKQRDVVAIFSYMPQITDIICPFLEKDKMPVMAHTGTEASAATPWVFLEGLPAAQQFTASLKWLEEQWPNYPTKPKVGVVGWNSDYEKNIVGPMEEYCLARPDKFEWVGAFLSPMGTMTWGSEIIALKGCDYIAPCHAGGGGQATFIDQFRNAGYTATFFGGEAMPCWTGLIIPKVGWEAMDGSFSAVTHPWFSDDSIQGEVATEGVAKHPGETAISLGYGYVSQVGAQFFWYNMIKAAIEEVGPENVTGQSCYNSFENFHITLPDSPEKGFTPTSRVDMQYARVYEWSAAAQDLVQISDWFLAPE